LNDQLQQSDREISAEVQTAQIRLLYQHPFLIAANILNAALVVAVLWQKLPHWALLGWLALFLVIIPARLLVANLHARHAWPTARAASWYVAGSAATGCVWGLLAFAVSQIPDPVYDVFIAFVLCGMTAGALLLDTPYLPAFVAFALPLMLPTAVAFLLRGDLVSIVMGVMVTAFTILLTAVGYRINRWIRETMRLQAQHEILTTDLHRANAELASREAQLQIIANHDQLTGLYNRYYLVDTLEREIHRAKRHQLPLSLAILDIDNFKSYNDTFGHHAGDEVLRALGSLLSASLRATDIVCRYGGEEFLVVFPDTDGVEALNRIHSACRDIKKRRYACRGQELPSVAVSGGLARYPRDGQSADELISAADKALYLAKQAGRDRVEVLS
jgi:diguanylate cyclase (GGDEF)-like protein